MKVYIFIYLIKREEERESGVRVWREVLGERSFHQPTIKQNKIVFYDAMGEEKQSEREILFFFLHCACNLDKVLLERVFSTNCPH